MLSRPNRHDLARFFSYVEIQPGGCWLWIGRLTPSGYGSIYATSAHRVAYRWCCGPIAPGDHVHHLCRVRRCVNPIHLEALRPTEHAGRHWKERGGGEISRMHLAPTQPGEIFEEEWRKPSGVSQAEAARRMGMSTNRLNEIVVGKRPVTAESAVLIAALTKTDPRFWLHLQADHDLWHVLQETDTKKIKPLEQKSASA